MKYGNYQPPKPPKKSSRSSNPIVRDEAIKRRNMDALRNNPRTAFGYKPPKKKSSKVLTTKKPKAR